MEQEKLEQIRDTIVHKKYVLDSCMTLALWLIQNEDEQLGLKLLQRATIHDNSKLSYEELDALAKISTDKSCLEDAHAKMSEYKKQAIELHWKNNRHHPEFFSCYENMSKLDILEMICDWHSRSVQYGTDMKEFVRIRQENRFHFPKEMMDMIWYYIDILLEETKKERR